jgi:hypothetical protein
MKHPLKLTTMKISKWFIAGFAMLCVLVIPAIGYSQSPPPPGPGGNGGNPDSPLGVPFDPYMNLAFLALSIVFAVVILKKYQKRGIVQLQ